MSVAILVVTCIFIAAGILGAIRGWQDVRLERIRAAVALQGEQPSSLPALVSGTPTDELEEWIFSASTLDYSEWLQKKRQQARDAEWRLRSAQDEARRLAEANEARETQLRRDQQYEYEAQIRLTEEEREASELRYSLRYGMQYNGVPMSGFGSVVIGWNATSGPRYQSP